MPCGYVYSTNSKCESIGCWCIIHIFCVRLLRCPFYDNGQFQSLRKRNGQQVRLSRFFCFIRALVSRAPLSLSTMKQTHSLLYLFIAVLISALNSACSSDDDQDSGIDICGYWHGEHQYYNPASGVKSQYLSMDFNSNGTGKLEYEGPDSYSVSYFTYIVSGSTVKCKGAHAGTSSAEVDTDFEMTLRIESNRLIPIDKYTTFILTRDGSVVTDGNGNEVVNYSKWLHGVWVRRDEPQILCLNPDNTYDEYVLPFIGCNTYSEHYSGTYDYNPVQKWLTINGTRFSIVELLEVSLGIEPSKGKIWWYDKGTDADKPKAVNVVGALTSHTSWSTKDKTKTYIFTDADEVVYLELGKKVGSYGNVSLMAKGNYALSNNTLTCNYTEVDWEYSSSYPNMFPGWTAGVSATKIFTVKIFENTLTMTDTNGASLYYFAD